LLQAICWLLPASRFKNWLLRLFGHTIGPNTTIGPTLVTGVRKFEIGSNVIILPFSAIRGLSKVELRDYAIIGSWNWISAAPVFQKVEPEAGSLYVGTSGRIGARSYMDCSGTIVIGAFAHVGGNRCFMQTHEPAFDSDSVSAGRITVGHHGLVGSCAVMLQGAVLPPHSVLAANSTMVRQKGEGRRGLYAGSPAVWKREAPGEWLERNTHLTTLPVFEEPMGVRPEDRALEDTHVEPVVPANPLPGMPIRPPRQARRTS
jgi:acetyltransferase-like isoleucine patch superfamily enzyme